MRYRILGQHQQEQLRSFTMDRRWYPMALYVCDDLHGVGSWSSESCADPPAPPPPKKSTVSFPDLPQSVHSRNAAKIAPCLCKVKFEIPFQVDGVHCVTFEGTGLIVDGAKGLVLVDRNTVPIALGGASFCVIPETLHMNLNVPVRSRVCRRLHRHDCCYCGAACNAAVSASHPQLRSCTVRRQGASCPSRSHTPSPSYRVRRCSMLKRLVVPGDYCRRWHYCRLLACGSAFCHRAAARR